MSGKSVRQSAVRRALGLLWRAVVVALGYTVAVIIGGLLTEILGLPSLSVAAEIDQTQMLVGILLAGLLVGLSLGPVSRRLALPTAQRAVLLFILLFILSSVINFVETLFFTTTPVAEQVTDVVTSGVGALGLCLLLSLLFQPEAEGPGLLTALRERLVQRGWTSWTWRFLLAGFLYMPTYILFGLVVSPIVAPYYEQLDLQLAIPGFGVMLPLAVFRGLLFVLTLFPLIAVLRGSRRSAASWTILALLVLAAWQPLMLVTWWPIPLRLAHGLEITADSIVHGMIIVWLLWTPVLSGRAEPGESRAADMPSAVRLEISQGCSLR